jgi:hypothetical protein
MPGIRYGHKGAHHLVTGRCGPVLAIGIFGARLCWADGMAVATAVVSVCCAPPFAPYLADAFAADSIMRVWPTFLAVGRRLIYSWAEDLFARYSQSGGNLIDPSCCDGVR